jgi:hypothetical protein
MSSPIYKNVTIKDSLQTWCNTFIAIIEDINGNTDIILDKGC